MAKYREIRSRIHGVDNTAKITQAMKMVAAAKLRRAQDSIIAARPYGKKLQELLQFLASNIETASNPLLEVRDVRRVCLIVVSADRGLCGAFNSTLLKTAMNLLRTEYAELDAQGRVDIVPVGKRAVDFFAKRPQPKLATFGGIFNALDFSQAQRIVSLVTKGYLDREFDKVVLVYNEFKSVVKQNVAVTQMLPIPKLEAKATTGPALDYIFEPSRDEILDALLPMHLNTQMWNVLLESNAAEQGARMTAMENATKNAKDLVKELRRSYNRARQTAITTEILEIVSGAEAQKSQ